MYQGLQGGKIGITNCADWREPASHDPADIAAAARGVIMKLGWFASPVFGGQGDYDDTVKALIGDKLPVLNDTEKSLLKNSSDFFGLNHYGSGFASTSQYAGWMSAYNSVSEAGLKQDPDATWLYSAAWGFRKLLNYVRNHYDSPEIIVTEGGWAAEAETPEDAVKDHDRVMYYANYTSEMRKAIVEDGVNITGYYLWSYVDNLEWEQGFSEKFGILFHDIKFGLDENAPLNKTHPGPNPTRRNPGKDLSWLVPKKWGKSKQKWI
eukprot:FR742312.1.p1 GENE.FR742312.1~~FR742312.1.p1  ORF type:complete len:265 (+),score=40.15 FR742312.1:222-1016(+)